MSLSQYVLNKFESLVNTEGIQTTHCRLWNAELFESLVNTEGRNSNHLLKCVYIFSVSVIALECPTIFLIIV